MDVINSSSWFSLCPPSLLRLDRGYIYIHAHVRLQSQRGLEILNLENQIGPGTSGLIKMAWFEPIGVQIAHAGFRSMGTLPASFPVND